MSCWRTAASDFDGWVAFAVAVFVLTVNSSRASFTSVGQGDAALAITGVDSETRAAATSTGRDFICLLHSRVRNLGAMMRSPGATPEPILRRNSGPRFQAVRSGAIAYSLASGGAAATHRGGGAPRDAG